MDSEIYFLLGIANNVPMATTITCVSSEIMLFEWKVVNIEMKQDMGSPLSKDSWLWYYYGTSLHKLLSEIFSTDIPS